jgi:tetratricopeptide (TPR) repeat protein
VCPFADFRQIVLDVAHLTRVGDFCLLPFIANTKHRHHTFWSFAMSVSTHSHADQTRHHHSQRQRVRVNWKLVGGLALGLGAAVGFGYVRYRSFQQVQLPLLWDLARRDLDHGDRPQALAKTQLYFLQRPDDIPALTEMAEWCLAGRLEAHAGNRLYRQLTETTRRHPSETGLAHLAYRLALRLAPVVPADQQDSLWSDARGTHYPALAAEDQRDPEVRRGLARCHAALEDSDRAARELLDLIHEGDRSAATYHDLVHLVSRRNPVRPDSTSAELSYDVRTRLARLLLPDQRTTELGDGAWSGELRQEILDRLLERMVSDAEPAWQGLLLQSRTWAERGAFDRAEEAARQAVARSARDAETLAWLMDLSLHRASLAGAQRQWFEQRQHEVAAGEVATIGSTYFPEDPRFAYELGRLALDAGHAQEAEKHFRQALQRANEAFENPRLEWSRQAELGRLRVPAQIWLGNALVMQAVDSPHTPSAQRDAEIQSIHDQLDRWGLFSLAELGRAQLHTLRKEWDEAIAKWNVIVVDPEMAPWARMATAMLITCHSELGQWRELGVVAERAVANWPAWEPGVAALELHYQQTNQMERLELSRERRREHDALLALSDRYRSELEKPESERDLTSLEAQARQLGQTDEFSRDLRVILLRATLLHALGDTPQLHDLLRQMQYQTPRVAELMVERIEFELNREDEIAERKIQEAAEAIDLFRDAFDTTPRLDDDLLASESRLALALARSEGPLTRVLHGLLRELRGDLTDAQHHLVAAFHDSPDGPLAAQKLVEFYLRHKAQPRSLSDQLLEVVSPLLLNLTDDRGLVWAQQALEECRQRGTLTTERQRDLALLYVRRNELARATAEWEDLLDKSPDRVSVLWSYSGVLAGLPEPTAAQRGRLRTLCGELERLRPGSLESRLRLLQSNWGTGSTWVATDLLASFERELDENRTPGLLRSLGLLGRLDSALSRLPQPEDQLAHRLIAQTAAVLSDEASEIDPEDYRDLIDHQPLADAVRTEVVSVLAEAVLAASQPQTAEQLLQRSLAHRKDGRQALQLATLVGQQGRVNEAFETWSSHAGALPAETAASIEQVLAAQADDLDLKRTVDQFLSTVAKADGLTARHSPLLLLLARLHMAPGRIERAIEVYERLLQLDPHSGTVLNNLAYAEAFREDRRESALRHIDEAIAKDGARRQYRDTRATVLLQMGRTDEARRELEQLTAMVHSPVYCLHLAVAQHRLDNQNLAKEALRQGREQGLDPAELHPLEHSWFDEVRPLYESLETSLAQTQP